MTILEWVRREWAIFNCANGVHINCPCVSDTPAFTTRSLRPKGTTMTDTQPCITEGEHIRSQRHLRASCPVGHQPLTRLPSDISPNGRCSTCGRVMPADAEQDATVRYLLVELPLMPAGYPRLDPEEATERITRGLDTFLRTQPHPSLPLAEPATIEQVYPGDVVSPEDTAEHDRLREQLRAANDVANDPGSTEESIIHAWLGCLNLALTRWPGMPTADGE